MGNVHSSTPLSRSRTVVAATAVALVIFGTAASLPVQARIIAFDAPGATQTLPAAINNSKSITGLYADSASNLHGFLRTPDGTFATFDVSGATCGTYPHGINRSGTIVGDGVYHSGNYCLGHGFIRSPDGSLTTFDGPNAVSTGVSGINDGGMITGTYEDSSSLWHGFVRAANGTITSFDPSGSIDTGTSGINKAGVIAGSFEDSGKAWHGFVRAAEGTITTFDAPGATATYTAGINDSGAIAGTYTDHGNNYGFVRNADGTFVTFDPKQSNQVGVAAINDAGAMTGVLSTGGAEYGYVRAGDGTVKKIILKNSLGIWDVGGINGKGAVTGSFLDLDESTVHGFLRTP